MNNETTKLIESLANKLGTTTEYLWSILLRQAPVSAFIDLVQYAIIILYVYLIYKKHQQLSVVKEWKGGYREESGYSFYEEGAFIPMLIGSIIAVILVISMFFSIPDTINGFINPEYWALKKILSSVSDK